MGDPGLGGGTGAAGTSAGFGGNSGSATGGETNSGGNDPAEECEQPNGCVPGVPPGWLGPVAFWEGSSAQPLPACPAGYGAPQDAQGKLTAPDAECVCSCATQDQDCTGAVQVTLYADLSCQTPCINAQPEACSAVAGCNGNQGSLRAQLGAPQGGSCAATVQKTTEPPTWERHARLCQLSGEPSSGCLSDEQSCVPTPGLPFASQTCVYRLVLDGQPIPQCPASYSTGPSVLYNAFSDDRSCGACSCSGPAGGKCSGKILVSNQEDCSEAFEYDVGTGCQQFSLDARPTHASGSYDLSPGTCSVAGAPVAMGGVLPTGDALVVCCP